MKPEIQNLLLGLALCIGFIALGIHLLDHPNRVARTIGGANIVFFGALLAFAIFKLIKIIS